MAHNSFFVMPPKGWTRLDAGGYATVIWEPLLGSYKVTAYMAKERGAASLVRHSKAETTVTKNEAGFRGRQWEVAGMSDNQYRTLREAAQAFLVQELGRFA